MVATVYIGTDLTSPDIQIECESAEINLQFDVDISHLVGDSHFPVDLDEIIRTVKINNAYFEDETSYTDFLAAVTTLKAAVGGYKVKVWEGDPTGTSAKYVSFKVDGTTKYISMYVSITEISGIRKMAAGPNDAMVVGQIILEQSGPLGTS